MASIDALAATSLKLNAETEAALFEFFAAAARTPIIPTDALERISVGLVHEEIGIGIVPQLSSAILVCLAEGVPLRQFLDRVAE